MKFYTDVRKYGKTILHRGFDNGQPFTERVEYQPTLFVPARDSSQKTGWTDFYSDYPMVPVQQENMSEAWQEIEKYKSLSNIDLHGFEKFEYQFLVDNYPNEIQYDFGILRILNFDIEVDSSNGFPEPDVATETITSITAKKENENEYTVWGLKPHYTPTQDNVTYVYCESESALLNMFIQYWKDYAPNIVTGWNSNKFDIPYIYNRISNVLGSDRAKLLSPFRVARKGKKFDGRNEYEIVDLYGIQQLDYMLLYKVFTFKIRESYTLNHISHVELGEKKLSYKDVANVSKLLMDGSDLTYDENLSIEEQDEAQSWQMFYKRIRTELQDRNVNTTVTKDTQEISLQELANRDIKNTDTNELKRIMNWCVFQRDRAAFEIGIEYNLKDVELVSKLEKKMGLMRLATMLAYTTHVNYEDTQKQVRMWDSFIYYWLTKDNIVVPPSTEHKKDYKYEGAYVKEPKLGKHGWIVSFDVNSMYPAIIRLLNISPETAINRKELAWLAENAEE